METIVRLLHLRDNRIKLFASVGLAPISDNDLGLEMQRYTILVYRYIATCVSRYSDILYDTI